MLGNECPESHLNTGGDQARSTFKVDGYLARSADGPTLTRDNSLITIPAKKLLVQYVAYEASREFSP